MGQSSRAGHESSVWLASVIALTANFSSGAAIAQQEAPEYKRIAQFEERIVSVFGPSSDPKALLVGKSKGKGDAVLLLDSKLKVGDRVDMRKDTEAVGASADGRDIAELTRVETDGKTEWELTLRRRIPAGPGTSLQVSG